jgi:hypothetical protein
VFLLAPAGSQATVTIGSDLNRAPGFTFSCGSTCTTVQDSLDTDRLAPGGLGSPVNGIITRWRIRVGASTGAAALRVVRSDQSGQLATGVGTSATVTPPAGTISSFNTQLPIAVNDRIGLDCCTSGSTFFVSPATGFWFLYAPLLLDGDPGRPPTSVDGNREVAVNADIEPTSAFSVDKIRPRKNGKLRVTVTLPNAGTFQAGDRRNKKIGAATAAKKKKKKRKKKPRLLQTFSDQLPEGKATVVVRSTQTARNLLKAKGKKGKIKTKVRLAFTPFGGDPKLRVVKVKLAR